MLALVACVGVSLILARGVANRFLLLPVSSTEYCFLDDVSLDGMMRATRPENKASNRDLKEERERSIVLCNC